MGARARLQVWQALELAGIDAPQPDASGKELGPELALLGVPFADGVDRRSPDAGRHLCAERLARGAGFACRPRERNDASCFVS
jgi:hypothetical protein